MAGFYFMKMSVEHVLRVFYCTAFRQESTIEM